MASAVPAWNGDNAALDEYILSMKLYVRGTEVPKRGLSASRLMARLYGKDRAWIMHYPHEATLEDVTVVAAPCNLPRGVHDLLVYLKEKCGVVPVDDAGKYAKLYLKESQRAPRTPMKDCTTMLEHWETKLKKALHSIDPEIDATTPVFPEVLRAWFMLDQSNLSVSKKGQVLAPYGNQYGCAPMAREIRTQCEKKHWNESAPRKGQMPSRSIGEGKGERPHKIHLAADDEYDNKGDADSIAWCSPPENDRLDREDEWADDPLA